MIRGPISAPDAGKPCLGSAVLLIGAVGIAFEITLVRVFSIAQWHHFAYMIISLAMLGFAASGTALGILGSRIRGRELRLLRAGAVLLPAALVACYEISQVIPFETMQLATRAGHWAWLALLYLVLSVPFFLVSSCIATALLLRPRSIGRLYFFNMVGSGLGALALVGSLFVLPAHAMPYALAGVALVAAALVTRPWSAWWTSIAVLAAVLALSVAARGPKAIRVSEYKGLTYALLLPDADVVAARETAISRLTAVRSSFIRETPGQVSGYRASEAGGLPEQVGLYFDAGSVSPVHRFDGSLRPFAWLDHVTSAVPYHLVHRPSVVVIGAAGGTEVLNALVHRAERVTAIELDPGVPAIVERELAGFAGGLYSRPDVELVLAEGRGFLAGHPGRSFDVVQIALLDSPTASSAGVLALNESYLYTVEALRLYVERLSKDGVLAITRWLSTPPRDAIKLFATAIEALRACGVSDPGGHLALIRSWNAATLIVARSPLDSARVNAVRAFAGERGFDLSWLPGLQPNEVNRFTVLEEPAYYRAALELLSPDSEEFLSRHAFHVRPATDDRPYFFRFFRWRSFPALVRAAGPYWTTYVEWGYVALVATVVQAVAVALFLVLLPLALLARPAGRRSRRAAVVTCFGGLGLAFMFMEIAFIQTLMRWLHHPVYAVSVVLTTFLIFSGLGSLYADRRRDRPVRGVAIAVTGLALVASLYLVGLPSLFGLGADWSDPARVSASVAVLAPLSFLMGIPFPTCLQAVSDRNRALVVWAWGVNGAASVIGATVATLVAVHAGFRAVVIVALVMYIHTPLPLQRLTRPES